MLIYKATNTTNNKVYIGRTSVSLKRRIQGHLCNSKKQYRFQRALKKWGKENFVWNILFKTNNFNKLKEMEKFFIKQYNSFNFSFGYNSSKSSKGGGMFGKLIQKKVKRK